MVNKLRLNGVDEVDQVAPALNLTRARELVAELIPLFDRLAQEASKERAIREDAQQDQEEENHPFDQGVFERFQELQVLSNNDANHLRAILHLLDGHTRDRPTIDCLKRGVQNDALAANLIAQFMLLDDPQYEAAEDPQATAAPLQEVVSQRIKNVAADSALVSFWLFTFTASVVTLVLSRLVWLDDGMLYSALKGFCLNADEDDYQACFQSGYLDGSVSQSCEIFCEQIHSFDRPITNEYAIAFLLVGVVSTLIFGVAGLGMGVWLCITSLAEKLTQYADDNEHNCQVQRQHLKLLSIFPARPEPNEALGEAENPDDVGLEMVEARVEAVL